MPSFPRDAEWWSGYRRSLHDAGLFDPPNRLIRNSWDNPIPLDELAEYLGDDKAGWYVEEVVGQLIEYVRYLEGEKADLWRQLERALDDLQRARGS